MTSRQHRGTQSASEEVVGWAPWTAAAPDSARSAAPARRLPRRLLGAACLAVVPVACGFLGFVGSIDTAERAPDHPTDGIVALTGGAQRIGDAIDLLAGGQGRRLLITGVNERTSREEIARLNPTQRHLVACCVDLDYRARNTIGNAIETRRWMRENGFRSVSVVTSNYHMPRTLLELGHALRPDARVVPYPVVTDTVTAERWWRSPAALKLLGGEYAKFVVAWLRTRFENDPERSRAAVLMSRGRPVKPETVVR